MQFSRLLAPTLFAAFFAACAQSPAPTKPAPVPVPLAPDTATLKVTSKLVAVSAIVRDKPASPSPT